MKKEKKTYESPDIEVTRVEVESSICSGSVDIEANSAHGIETEAQVVNSGFKEDNNFADNGTWD